VLAVLGAVGDERALPVLFAALPDSSVARHYDPWAQLPVWIAAVVDRHPSQAHAALRRECDSRPVCAWYAILNLVRLQDPEAPGLLQSRIKQVLPIGGLSRMIELVGAFAPADATAVLLSLTLPSPDLDSVGATLLALIRRAGSDLPLALLNQCAVLPDQAGPDWGWKPIPAERDPVTGVIPPPRKPQSRSRSAPAARPRFILEDWYGDLGPVREAAAAELRRRGRPVPAPPPAPKPQD
jgi:hypothetical protein